MSADFEAFEAMMQAQAQDADRFRWLCSEGAKRGLLDCTALGVPHQDLQAMIAEIDKELARE